MEYDLDSRYGFLPVEKAIAGKAVMVVLTVF